MTLNFPFVIFISLFFLLSIEGFGFSFNGDFTFVLALVLSLYLLVNTLLLKKKLKIPKLTSVLFLFYVLSSFTSSIIGIGIQKSLIHSFFLFALLLFFLVSYNFSKNLRRILPYLMFLLASLFIVYSVAINFFHLDFHVPLNGYQFVFPLFGSHNHLGDFLTLPFIISVYNIYNRKNIKKSLVILLILLPFIFFSYSRSAYITIMITTAIIHFNCLIKKHELKYKLVARLSFFLLILSTIFYLIVISRQAENQPLPAHLHSYLTQNGKLDKYREFSGGRLEYYNLALSSFSKNIFLGSGPNNFYEVSKRIINQKALVPSENVHNIFLEIAVGQGLTGLIPFIFLIMIILIKSRKNALYYVFIAMLINFQTDYTYQIYSFMVLFFCIAGAILSEKQYSEVKNLTNSK